MRVRPPRPPLGFGPAAFFGACSRPSFGACSRLLLRARAAFVGAVQLPFVGAVQPVDRAARIAPRTGGAAQALLAAVRYRPARDHPQARAAA
eukprot:5646618-Prymnesium_polylepis.1